MGMSEGLGGNKEFQAILRALQLPNITAQELVEWRIVNTPDFGRMSEEEWDKLVLSPAFALSIDRTTTQRTSQQNLRALDTALYLLIDKQFSVRKLARIVRAFSIYETESGLDISSPLAIPQALDTAHLLISPQRLRDQLDRIKPMLSPPNYLPLAHFLFLASLSADKPDFSSPTIRVFWGGQQVHNVEEAFAMLDREYKDERDKIKGEMPKLKNVRWDLTEALERIYHQQDADELEKNGLPKLSYKLNRKEKSALSSQLQSLRVGALQLYDPNALTETLNRMNMHKDKPRDPVSEVRQIRYSVGDGARPTSARLTGTTNNDGKTDGDDFVKSAAVQSRSRSLPRSAELGVFSRSSMHSSKLMIVRSPQTKTAIPKKTGTIHSQLMNELNTKPSPAITKALTHTPTTPNKPANFHPRPRPHRQFFVFSDPNVTYGLPRTTEQIIAEQKECYIPNPQFLREFYFPLEMPPIPKNLDVVAAVDGISQFRASQARTRKHTDYIESEDGLKMIIEKDDIDEDVEKREHDHRVRQQLEKKGVFVDGAQNAIEQIDNDAPRQSRTSSPRNIETTNFDDMPIFNLPTSFQPSSECVDNLPKTVDKSIVVRIANPEPSQRFKELHFDSIVASKFIRPEELEDAIVREKLLQKEATEKKRAKEASDLAFTRTHLEFTPTEHENTMLSIAARQNKLQHEISATLPVPVKWKSVRDPERRKTFFTDRKEHWEALSRPQVMRGLGNDGLDEECTFKPAVNYEMMGVKRYKTKADRAKEQLAQAQDGKEKPMQKKKDEFESMQNIFVPVDGKSAMELKSRRIQAISEEEDTRRVNRILNTERMRSRERIDEKTSSTFRHKRNRFTSPSIHRQARQNNDSPQTTGRQLKRDEQESDTDSFSPRTSNRLEYSARSEGEGEWRRLGESTEIQVGEESRMGEGRRRDGGVTWVDDDALVAMRAQRDPLQTEFQFKKPVKNKLQESISLFQQKMKEQQRHARDIAKHEEKRKSDRRKVKTDPTADLHLEQLNIIMSNPPLVFDRSLQPSEKDLENLSIWQKKLIAGEQYNVERTLMEKKEIERRHENDRKLAKIRRSRNTKEWLRESEERRRRDRNEKGWRRTGMRQRWEDRQEEDQQEEEDVEGEIEEQEKEPEDEREDTQNEDTVDDMSKKEQQIREEEELRKAEDEEHGIKVRGWNQLSEEQPQPQTTQNEERLDEDNLPPHLKPRDSPKKRWCDDETEHVISYDRRLVRVVPLIRPGTGNSENTLAVSAPPVAEEGREMFPRTLPPTDRVEYQDVSGTQTTPVYSIPLLLRDDGPVLLQSLKPDTPKREGFGDTQLEIGSRRSFNPTRSSNASSATRPTVPPLLSPSSIPSSPLTSRPIHTSDTQHRNYTRQTDYNQGLASPRVISTGRRAMTARDGSKRGTVSSASSQDRTPSFSGRMRDSLGEEWLVQRSQTERKGQQSGRQRGMRRSGMKSTDEMAQEIHEMIVEREKAEKRKKVMKTAEEMRQKMNDSIGKRTATFLS
ncbi:hypothetical protein BLNAU_16965 [Blattamonas nauphoetae]|uniref:Uncharacterized protein n=1 Tax=Blattamonas nauphoetae TaxID=2049346 RepID=A0ABQ9XA17_9EUKA|nr:hypothetical protein BLNAU_16965 [Blattamonas nauphoetae]